MKIQTQRKQKATWTATEKVNHHANSSIRKYIKHKNKTERKEGNQIAGDHNASFT